MLRIIRRELPTRDDEDPSTTLISLGCNFEELSNIPCNLVLIRSRGCNERVVAIPAVNPARVSTKDDEKP
jgi:hypothetical protein